MKHVLSALLLTLPLFAGQSVTVTSGMAYVTLPTAAPWTAMGAAAQSSRWELRLHGIGSLPAYALGLLPQQLGSSQDGRAINFTTQHNPPVGDTIGQQSALPACCTTGDYLIRFQRNSALNQYSLELCSTQAGTCVSSTAAITAYGQVSWAGWQFYITSGYSVAFLRWFSTPVPVGTPIQLSNSGDLADWEFEGSLTDSVHGLTFSGAPVTYSTTPLYPPVCNAGPQQTFRAGFPGQLDGSASYALDGATTLTYFWQQVQGVSPRNVLWNHTQRLPTPTVDGLITASYNFQLTVTDGSGQSTSCIVHDGAVATDDNGVVITNNPFVDQLLGPMIQFGKNPWPWMDDRHKYVADVQVNNIDAYYLDFWDPPGNGTITVTAGSSTITGTGTHFLTDICNADGTAKSNMAVIVHWNGGANRRAVMVGSCADDTHFTVSAGYAWNPNPAYPQTETVGYSFDNQIWLVWQIGGNAQYPANYYDNVAAFYALYYRSGIDTYLAYARKLADEFWASPMMDQGLTYDLVYGAQWGYPGRAWSVLGLLLRASDGRPDMWNGLHALWNVDLFWTRYPNSLAPYSVGDERETGYRYFRLGLCALYDPSSTLQANCRDAIKSNLSSFWKPVHDQYGGGYFPGYAVNPYISTGNGMDVYVTATNGSSTITLHSNAGTTFHSQYFPGAVWMWPCVNPGPADGCGYPAGNSGGDPNWYYVTYVDGTHATLADQNGIPVPYTGASGSKGLSLNGPWTGPSATSIAFGYGTQPFMQGIIASALDIDAQAMYAGNFDPASGALYEQYAGEQLTWLQNNALYAPAKGMWYFVGHVDCPIGNENPILCGQPDPNNPSASRILNAEAVRGAMFAWSHTGQPEGVGAFVDMMVNAMFAKPGTCPPGSLVCTSDGHYLDNYENSSPFLTGVPPGGANPKWFGMPFGLNPIASWPAIRLGGASPPKYRTMQVGFNLQRFPDATHINVLLTAPSGQVASTECAASPCAVTVDARQGGYLLQIQYLSATGAVLATQEVPFEAAR